MVIVVRKDLKEMMKKKGKIAAQVSHAVLGAILSQTHREYYETQYSFEPNLVLPIDFESPLTIWLNNSFTKVCVGVNSEQELLDLYEKVKDNFIHKLILDDGRTCFNNIPTYTCLAIGPAFNEDFVGITDHLSLL